VCVLIFQHEDATPPGSLTEWLSGQTATTDVVRTDLTANTPNVLEYDLLISLGAEYAAYNESLTSIETEAELMRKAADADIPILGICFGGQLLARALGGSVQPARKPEIGWRKLRSHAPELVPTGPWFEWHFDCFTPP